MWEEAAQLSSTDAEQLQSGQQRTPRISHHTRDNGSQFVWFVGFCVNIAIQNQLEGCYGPASSEKNNIDATS